MAAAFAVMGAFLGPVAVRAFVPQMLADLLSTSAIVYAVCGAAVGWIVGYAFGAFAFEADARTAVVARPRFRPGRTGL